MNRTLRQIIRILDGQPTGRRGQSLVELTLTMPFLFLMIMGVMEIGFLANDYLILTDTVREAGRKSVNLYPTQWDPYNPKTKAYTTSDDRNYERMDCDNISGLYNLLGDTDQGLDRGGHPATGSTPNWNVTPPGWRAPVNMSVLNAYGFASSSYGSPPNVNLVDTSNFGFFDTVACQAIFSMQPLYFDTNRYPPPAGVDTGKDDVVVSAVAFIKQKHIPNPNGTAFQTDRMRVTGRWPIGNRLCTNSGIQVLIDPNGPPNGPTRNAGDTRDPFNFETSADDSNWSDGPGADQPGTQPNADPDMNDEDPAAFLTPLSGPAPSTFKDFAGHTGVGGVRGFILTGQWVNPDGCLGSQFTTDDLEARLNQDNKSLDYLGDSLLNYSVAGGMVVVEVHWQYHPIFFGPVLDPIFQGNANAGRSGDPMLNVYGFFPVTDVEPTVTP